ncbi:MAG: hypothetical protein K1X28_03715 [Parachlamydiales bacterium]|nr:hypothetical protein [Parachlamydiales bacterium]
MLRKLIFLFVLPFTLLRAQSNIPDDQLLVVFGSSGYVIYKVLDFANDHGYRYIKILSYEFNAFEHTISGVCKGDPSHGGRYFELKDDNISIKFLCFEEKPEDIYIIDLEKYQSLLDDVRAAEDDNW